MFGLSEINRDSIIKYPNPILRSVSKEVKFPLSQYNIDLFKKMRQYVIESVDEELATLKKLEPSVGIAAPQIASNIRACAVYVEEDKIHDYILINPKIISKSKEIVYVENGEGCLSIPNKIEGNVHRYKEVEIEYYDMEGKKKKLKAGGFLSVVLQHEIDHLDGILYFDHIDKSNPFNIKEGAKSL